MTQITSRPDPAVAGRLDPVLDSALAEQRIAGGVALVARDGVLVYARAVGQADVEAGKPMALGTIFRAASLTKPIVTAAALALVEDGVIGLEDPVTRYLPDFQPKWQGEAPVITVRHLLTHTAGLGYGFLQPNDGPYLQLGVSDGMDQPGLTFEENLPRIVEAGLFFPPGAAWLYSVGMDVLGAALEKATGKSLGEVVAERITRKLGMADTGFSVTDRDRLAAAYADGPPPVRMGETHVVPFAELSGIRFAPDRIFDPKSFPSGGAGMACSAPDMLAFLEAVRTGGGPILGESTAKSMMTNQTGELPIVIVGPGVGFGFGGAVVLDPSESGSPHLPGAWQWGGVYGHSWFVDPARRTSVVLMTNTSVEGMSGRLSQEFAAAAAAATA
jgi:CubicO group peptidase (beta-lactamase class C family)